MPSLVWVIVVILAVGILGHILTVRLWSEKASTEPEKTVRANVLSKKVKPGTHRSGRSKGGFSYIVTFLTENGEPIELFAYEIEFGGLKEGMQGTLTYQGRYFVRFEE